MYLVDTNILSFLIRGNINIETKFAKHSNEIFLSCICEIGSFVGAKRIKSLKLINDYELIYETFPVLSFGSKESRLFSNIKVDLLNSGIIIEDFDIMIAVQALANDLILVTNNTKHFERIKGLKTEDWI